MYNVWSLANTYGAPGANNGNVLEQLITAPGADAARQVYKYDHVNRLKLFTEKATNVDATTCQAAAAPLCEEFGYDQWGNRRIVDRSGVGPSLSEPGEFSSATNRITTAGFTYDGGVPGPGNLTATPVGAFAYDAENRMISGTTALGTTQYVYDAEGRRVKKVDGTTGTVYVYDAAGQLAAEYGGTAPAATTRAYLTQDHLGSTRVVTNKEGTEVVERRDYMPFGEEIAAPEGSWRLSVPGYLNASATVLKFTGQVRDIETGLDYFGARYFSGAQGRFTSPDSPSYSKLSYPQTWNLYAYALNNPLGYVDPSGHEIVCVGNAAQCQKDAQTATADAEAASRVKAVTKTTQHSFLGIFHWTTSKTTIAITGDMASFRALSPNASRLADLVTTKQAITVNYGPMKEGGNGETGRMLDGGSTSRTPMQGWADPTAWIDPVRRPGQTFDTDAAAQGLPAANTAEEFAHEVLGHVWGELFGLHFAGTRANMRDSIQAENAVRALDPQRGQKGLTSHHHYDEMPPDPQTGCAPCHR